MEFDLNRVELSYYDKNIGLTLPRFASKELAEFLGILAGDGYINKYGKYFSFLEIAGDSRLDYDYLVGYVSQIIYELFNILPSVQISKKRNAMALRIMSKGLNNYLQRIGFQSGRKKGMAIPSWILLNDEYLNYFVRGLADTDGCLTLLNRNQKNFLFYPRVQVSLDNKYVISTIGSWLKSKGISLSLQTDYKKVTYKGNTKIHVGYRFQINGRKQVEKWMQLVGFRNKKHLDKYEKYKKMGTAGFEFADSQSLMNLPQRPDLQSGVLPD